MNGDTKTPVHAGDNLGYDAQRAPRAGAAEPMNFIDASAQASARRAGR